MNYYGWVCDTINFPTQNILYESLSHQLCPHFTVIDVMHWRHVSITTTPCWGQDLSRCAHVLLEERVSALSPSVSARARAGPAVWHAGVGPLATCLAMAHVAVPRLTPNTRGRPSVTSYAYGLLPSPSERTPISRSKFSSYFLSTQLKENEDPKSQEVVNLSRWYMLYWSEYCIHGYFCGGFIFANFARQSSRKFPLQYMAIVMKTSQKSRN